MVERGRNIPEQSKGTKPKVLFENNQGKDRFVKLVQENTVWMKQYARRLPKNDWHQAEDQVQETLFVTAKLMDAEKFDPDAGTEKGFLRTVLRNTWIRDLKKIRGQNWQRPSMLLVEDLLSVEAQAANVASPEDALTTQLVIQEELNSLTLKQRKIVELSYFEDMSAIAIGEQLDLQPSAVRSYLRFVRKKMQGNLEKKGITNTILGE